MIGSLNSFAKRLILKSFSEKTIHFLKKSYFPWKMRRGIDHYARKEKDFNILEKFIFPGNIVIDIGANVGIYTMKLSQLVGYDGQVFAFEPIPVTYDILSNNIKKLGLNNVKTYCKALSEENGFFKMVVPTNQHGVKNYYLSRLVLSSDSAESESYNVETQRLDEFVEVNEIRDVHFIKCDVEGAELLVMKGAEHTIEIFKPHIMCEIAGHGRAFAYQDEDLFGFFLDLGYSSSFYNGVQLVSCNEPQKGQANYLFIHRSMKNRVINLDQL